LRQTLFHARKKTQHALIVFVDRRAVAPRISAHQQIFTHRHVAEQPPRFRHRADTAPHDLRRAEAADRLAFERDAAGTRLVQTENQLHRGRLAARVAAEQAHDLPAPHLKIDVEMHLHGAVERFDMFEFQ